MTLEQLVMARLIPKPLDGKVYLGPARTRVLEVLREYPGTVKNFSSCARKLNMNPGTFSYHAIQLAQQEVVRIVYFYLGGKQSRHMLCGSSEIVPWVPGKSFTSKRETTYRKKRLDDTTRAYYLFEVSHVIRQDDDGQCIGGGSPFVD